MRAFMVIVFAATLFLSAWANNLQVADAGQASAGATVGLTNATSPAPQ
jgi:hypothetical protein